MCGIAGYLNRNGRPVNTGIMEKMLAAIHHRGPDDMGLYIDHNAAIGMRRLSIIDLASGHQPISNENDTLFIVFNGEIYNYLELRNPLENKGHKFKTDTDTEVILHLYEEYGTECVNRLNGMFAFAIWDSKQNAIFGARDHLGIKPFYYHLTGEKFIFASELKAILEEPGLPLSLDLTALGQFLSFEFIPAPRTLLKSIKKLPPGHWFYVSKQSEKIEQYWKIEDVRPTKTDFHETAEELNALLKDAVRLQLRSDVPLGTFLSGGIDSSTITALMGQVSGRGVNTFSIGFDDSSYNELAYAREVSKMYNTDHTEFIIKPASLNLIEKLIYHLDDPIGDFSIFPTYIISQLARSKVKVILSGDGGDEIFGGYDTYLAQKLFSYYNMLPFVIKEKLIKPFCTKLSPTEQKKGTVNKLKRYIEGAGNPGKYGHFRWMTFLKKDEYNSIFTDDISSQIDSGEAFGFINSFMDAAGDTGLNKSMMLDVKTYLPENILAKVDKMSMAASLETRVPLLDKRVVELSFQMPAAFKINGFKTKHILKKVSSNLLPPNVINRPKQGFSIPVKNWIKGEAKPMMTDLLSFDRLNKQKIFNPNYVQNLISSHLENKTNNSHILWSLMIFQLWQQKFIEKR